MEAITLKVNPEFRKQVDTLFFTNQENIDLKNFKKNLRSNHPYHLKYFWDRLYKSSNIAWEAGFWESRFALLNSIKYRKLIVNIENYLINKLNYSLKLRNNKSILSKLEYIQFLEFSKIRYPTSTSKNIKNFLYKLPSFVSYEKLITFLQDFYLSIKDSITDYICNVIFYYKKFPNLLRLIKDLKNKNFEVDEIKIFDSICELVFDRKNYNKIFYKSSLLLECFSDENIFLKIKEKFISNKNRVFEIIKSLNILELEANFFNFFKKIILLDPIWMDDLLPIYLEKVYSRSSTHKRSNTDKILNLLKEVPTINFKKIINWLAKNKKHSDIQYLMQKFPEFNKLSVFI
jgi:hypothetical protein